MFRKEKEKEKKHKEGMVNAKDIRKNIFQKE